MPHLLEMEGISKAYPGVQALSGVDFVLERGEIHALCGKNGAGKSTLIRVLGGVVAPDGGRILLDGEPVALASPAGAMARGIVVVHQELSLVPGLAVAENLFLGRPQAWLVRRGPILAAARAVLSRLDSAIDPAAPVASLSIAQAQTVEIAKALAREPASSSSTSPPRRWPRRTPSVCSPSCAVSPARGWGSFTSPTASPRSSAWPTALPCCATGARWRASRPAPWTAAASSS